MNEQFEAYKKLVQEMRIAQNAYFIACKKGLSLAIRKPLLDDAKAKEHAVDTFFDVPRPAVKMPELFT